MQPITAVTHRGIVLDGVRFAAGKEPAGTVVVAITGIHGNFISNPFYYNIGNTLNRGEVDFIYAQTCDAFGRIRTRNVRRGREEIIGSWNERFSYACEDIAAWLDYAEHAGYRHVLLAGHSLGANKVIRYLSKNHDQRVKKFILMSPANLTYMTSAVSEPERAYIRHAVESGHGSALLPFPFMGWVECIADTAADWLGPALNNVHNEHDGDFSQAAEITHTGALLIGTFDRFTDGDPTGFLTNLNNHIPTAAKNRLYFIEGTGHTYQRKEQELADLLLKTTIGWRNRDFDSAPASLNLNMEDNK